MKIIHSTIQHFPVKRQRRCRDGFNYIRIFLEARRHRRLQTRQVVGSIPDRDGRELRCRGETRR